MPEKNTTATLIQQLTLCPGATYAFKAWTRVLRPLAHCEATFKLGDTEVGIVMPTYEWTSGIARSKNYTAEEAEVRLGIDIKCPGTTSSTAVGTIDFDDLSLERVFS